MKKHALIGAALLFIGFLVLTGTWRPFKKSRGELMPCLDVKRLIDLGCIQNGTFVPAPIEFFNRGSSVLTLSEFRSNCSCIRLYRMENGVKYKFKTISLDPGEVSEVFADLRVSGEPGTQLASSIWCKTNDPDNQDVQINLFYTPVAKLYTVPGILLFGQVACDTPVKKRLELRSDGSFHKQINKLTTSEPDRFAVSFTTVDEAGRKASPVESSGQSMVGFLDVTLLGRRSAGIVDSEMAVLNDGEELLRLPVSGTIVPELQLIPDRLTFPRSSGKKASYSANVLFRCDRPEHARVAFLEEGLPFVVTVPQQNGSDAGEPITVSYTGSRSHESAKIYTLHFRLEQGRETPTLELPVTILPWKE